MQDHELPLFPLRSVLFPGGGLGLRVFEPRYLDLVRDCLRQDRGFGICLILEGEEVGAPALPAAWGCEARIVDFSRGDDGLLGIVVRGARRFHVEATRVRDNGLLVGRVRWVEATAAQAIRPEHQLLAVLLQRLHDQAAIGTERRDIEDADWVGWRMAEWLPLSMPERLGLLQEHDPHLRLQRLIERLPDFQPE